MTLLRDSEDVIYKLLNKWTQEYSTDIKRMRVRTSFNNNKEVDMESVKLHLRWNNFCTWDTVTLAGECYTMERPKHILDWKEFMNWIFKQWRERGFTVKEIFYPSRGLFTIKISNNEKR